jgi:hypothetical protein
MEVHKFFFLDKQTLNIIPPHKSDIMIKFPYNTVGRHMENNLNHDGSFRLLFHPLFSPGEEEYVLPVGTNKPSLNKEQYRTENAYQRMYDNGSITKDEYTQLNTDPRVYLTDGTIATCGRWFLRYPDGDIQSDVAIIPPALSDLICKMFDAIGPDFTYKIHYGKLLLHTLENVDKYLYGHQELLEKRLIFFVCNEYEYHWFGMCAVSPWKAIVQAHEKCKEAKLHGDFTKNKNLEHKDGIIYNDSLGPQEKVTNNKEIIAFLWLLNMMSHYRDMRLSGKSSVINYVWMHEHLHDTGYHMFLMGMDGPFGNLFVDTTETIPYPIIYRPPKARFQQPDTWNCAVCWLLFAYDNILAFHHRPFMETSCGDHDVQVHFGKYVHSKAWLTGKGTGQTETSKVVNPLLTLFRKEMVLIIEHMRWCFLLANHCDVIRLPSWGDIHQNHAAILDSTDHGKYVQPILDERNNDLNTPMHQLYLREKYLRKRVNDGSKIPALETDTKVFLKIIGCWLKGILRKLSQGVT